MKSSEAFKSLKQKFQSGNSVPVAQATITREEWEAVARTQEMTKALIRMIEVAGVDTVCSAMARSISEDPEKFEDAAAIMASTQELLADKA